MIEPDCLLCAGMLAHALNPPPPKPSGGTRKLVANVNLSWNFEGRPLVLNVCFTEYTPKLKDIQDRIIKYANEWLKPDIVAGIEIKKLEAYDQNAHIRIHIAKQGDDNYSLIGTNSLYKKEPEYYSMQLALDGVKDEEDPAGVNMFRRRVLHEFGHALGFKHEAARSPWWAKVNKGKEHVIFPPKNAVSEQAKKIIEGIEAQVGQLNNETVIVFGKLEDRKSVMMYPMLDPDDDPQIPWNTKLSDEDKKYANKFYPKLSRAADTSSKL